jgi:hypothetical protein
MRKTYQGVINNLPPHGVFVFGSNTQGRHGKGSALIALRRFGAIYGVASGLQGSSWAIITKDLTKRVHPSRTPEQIKEEMRKLYSYAKTSLLDFYVVYTTKGVNLNSYSAEDMAKMFAESGEIPLNIIFEKEFNDIVEKYEKMSYI